MRYLALALLLAAVPAQAANVLNRGGGAEPESLDPAFAGSSVETDILGDLMVGLTTRDTAAHAIPGMAERWEISPDGLTWTFHLRNARWSNGKPVTAQDFVFAWRRSLDPKTGARQAQMMWIIKNARDITAGHMPVSALGVRASSPSRLDVTLERPTPYLPELLTLPVALPLPENPSFAPGHYISNGAYLLKSWLPNDHIGLVKNPQFYDAASVKIDAVNYYPTNDTQAAMRRLRAGELDMQTPLPVAQLPWIRANMPGSLHIMPSLGLAYIAINLRDPALADKRVRRALNLVYDREAVAGKVMKLGEQPAYSYVPPISANYTGGPQMDFKSVPYPVRLAQAKRLMQEAGYSQFNKLTLTFSTSGNPDSKRLAAVFQAMARQVYIDLRIAVSDYPTVLSAMRQGRFQLAYSTWLADFDDASNFLDLLRSDSPRNYSSFHSPQFDNAMTPRSGESDSQRIQRLQTAERIALDGMPWLPIRFLSQTEAVAPRVGGYIPNIRDYHRSRWLWIKRAGLWYNGPKSAPIGALAGRAARHTIKTRPQ